MQLSRLDMGGGPGLIWSRLRLSLDRSKFSVHNHPHIPISYFLLFAGDVWFSLNGTTYQNNSLVNLEDIGDGDAALLCMTNLTGVNESVRGNWYFPNETGVFSTHNDSEIYGTRSQMMLRLNRRKGGVEGIYHCKIFDAMNVTQAIYIGVYNTSTGE